MMTSKTTEDYLKAIYQAHAGQRGAGTTDLAERLGVAPASVTGMLKKLAAQELVTYTRYQGVALTSAGRAVALDVLRRHRLAERYLADVLGLSWDRVHDEAEEWEHVLSKEVAARMDAALGWPSTDPHGEPIPSASGDVPALIDMPLARLQPQESARVARVSSEDAAFLRYLGSLGIYPDVALTVISIAPFGGPVTVEVRGERHAIGQGVAEKVFVDDVAPAVRAMEVRDDS
jgi:DtxR family transcriptional regulator, Mn-dependent transcriptional regulator